MSSLPTNFPISLRAQPSSNGTNSLSDLIRRINAQEGGFLNVTEESLRQRIEAEQENEDGEEDSSSEDEDEEEPDRAKELMKAREEMLAQLE